MKLASCFISDMQVGCNSLYWEKKEFQRPLRESCRCFLGTGLKPCSASAGSPTMLSLSLQDLRAMKPPQTLWLEHTCSWELSSRIRILGAGKERGQKPSNEGDGSPRARCGHLSPQGSLRLAVPCSPAPAAPTPQSACRTSPCGSRTSVGTAGTSQPHAAPPLCLGTL